MKVSVDVDAEEDLPESDRPDTEEEANTLLLMFKGTVESGFDDVFDPDVKVSMRADVGDYKTAGTFSLNDPNFGILCFECNNIVSRGMEAQNAFHEYVGHIEDESNPCCNTSDYGIDNDIGRLKSLRDAMRDGEEK